MTRTYWIKYESLGITHFDKITHKSVENRARWHKVEALTEWKKNHNGYGWMRIDHVLTRDEMISNGFKEAIK